MSRDSSTALGMTGHWSLVRQFSLDASLSFTSSQNRAPHRLYLPCRHVFRRFAVVPRMHPSSRTRYHHPGVPIAMAESMQSFTTTLDELERRLHEIDHMMGDPAIATRSEEHTSELQSRFDLVCRLLLEKKNTNIMKVREPLTYSIILPTTK